MPGTRLISGGELRSLVEAHVKKHGPAEGRRRAYEHLKEALEKKHLRPRDFSITDLFRAFCKDSAELLLEMHPKAGQWSQFLEAGPGATVVGYSDFSNITGQLFFTEMLDAFESEEFVFSRAIEHKQSAIQDVEKIAGVSRIGDDFSVIGEGGEYPRLGVGEDYIEIAYKQKRGGIVPVTTEAVRGDKTGLLLDRCNELGDFLGVNVEKRVIDAVIDEGTGASGAHSGGHRYTWKGTAYATYQGTTPWVNAATSNALVDETDIDALWQLLVAITDPYTGEPIRGKYDTLIVSPDLVWRAHRIVRTTEVNTAAGGYPTSGNPILSTSAPALNAVLPNLKILSSSLLKQRLTTDTDWFLGDVRRAVRRYYNWDITPDQRSKGTDAEFYRDVVMEYKASLKDCVSVVQPRCIGKSSA